MSKLNVLVVGASIAGPTVAYWLAKAGARVTIIERFPKLRKAGHNIDIRTTGVAVMRKMPGMEAAVRAKSADIEGISFVRDSGSSCGIIRPTGNPDQQSLVSEYEILRGDLSRVLFDLTKDNKNIEYVFGEQVASMQQNEKEDGPVKVEFANGYPTAEFDLVVACDGSHSRTRAMGLGCGARDFITPTNCWAAFMSIKQDMMKGSRVAKAYSAVGGRWIAAGLGRTDGTLVTVMGIHPRSDGDITLPFREAMKAGDDELKKYVATHFKGAGWRTDEFMKSMMGAEDFYANEIVEVHVPHLSKGRFALVGDSGYAPSFTGTGTTLALTGAYVLAGEICKHKGDLAAGLAGYEEQMRPIIKELQKVGLLIPAALAPQTKWGIWLRNSIFAFIAWSRIIEFAQKYIAGSFANSEKSPLQDYEWVQ